MSIRVTNAVVLLALLGATACRIEPTPQVSADDPANVARAEIELTLRNYQESLIAGDARRAASVFTTGAHLYLPDEPVITTRGGIDRLIEQRSAAEQIVDMSLEYDTIDIGTGVAHQFATMHQRLRDADGEEREIEGHYAIRWVRAADSVWRIDRLLVHHAPADTAAAAES